MSQMEKNLTSIFHRRSYLESVFNSAGSCDDRMMTREDAGWRFLQVKCSSVCRERCALPIVSTFWLGSNTLPWPALSCTRQSSEGWLSSPPSSSGLSALLCCWGQVLLFLRRVKTSNSVKLPSSVPALPTDACFVIDSELWVKLCCE